MRVCFRVKLKRWLISAMHEAVKTVRWHTVDTLPYAMLDQASVSRAKRAGCLANACRPRYNIVQTFRSKLGPACKTQTMRGC